MKKIVCLCVCVGVKGTSILEVTLVINVDWNLVEPWIIKAGESDQWDQYVAMISTTRNKYYLRLLVWHKSFNIR